MYRCCYRRCMGWQGPKAGGGMSPRGGGEGRRLEASQSNKIFCNILNRNESRGLTCSNGRRKWDGVKDNVHNLSNFYALFALMNIARGPTPPGVSRNSRSRPYPRMKVRLSKSLIPVPELWEWIFSFPSCSRVLGMLFSIPSHFRIMGMVFFHSLSVLELWQWIFFFDFRPTFGVRSLSSRVIAV